jgi:hypothetical protein
MRDVDLERHTGNFSITQDVVCIVEQTCHDCNVTGSQQSFQA